MMMMTFNSQRVNLGNHDSQNWLDNVGVAILIDTGVS